MAAHTGVLSVIGDSSMPIDRVIVNPNDGYDLGLLSDAIRVKAHGVAYGHDGKERRGYLLDVQLMQENDCRVGTILMGMKLVQQLGKPKNVQLYLENAKMVIAKIDVADP